VPLYTWEERFAQLQRELFEARRRADAAMEYAERSARLHHAAICRLYLVASGSYGWPPKE